jgi:hypothetical protein
MSDENLSPSRAIRKDDKLRLRARTGEEDEEEEEDELEDSYRKLN